MSIGFGFSDKELQVLTSKFSELSSCLSQAETSLKNEIGEIQTKVDSMKAEGVTILDEPSIKGLFDSVRAKFQEEQKKLEQIIAEFKTVCSAYETKRQKVLEKEIEILKRECDANADFASQHELLYAPIKRLQNELEEQQQKLLLMQNEYNTTFKTREEQLAEQIMTFSQQQKKAYDEMWQQLMGERQKVIERENAVIQRENKVSALETEVRNGLAEKRSQMMADIDVEKNRVSEQQAELEHLKQEYHQKQIDLETEKSKLQDRFDAVFKKEIQADKDFADKRAEMQVEFENSLQRCLDNIKEQESKASERREQLLAETIQMLENERATRLKQLSDEIARRRNEADAEIHETRSQLEREQEDFRKEKESLQQKEKELQEREAKIHSEEERQAQMRAFLEEKLRIDEEKFRKTAAEQIFAITEIADATRKSRDELAQQLTELRLKYEEQKAINDRFKNKTAEEIDSEITKLQVENERLKRKLKE